MNKKKKNNLSDREDLSNFVQELYEDYVTPQTKEREKRKFILLGIISVVIIIVFILIIDAQNRIKDFEEKYSYYNELNDSYNEFAKYGFVDLERTKETSYPYLIENFPETINYEKYCLPCCSIFNEIEDVFKNKNNIKRKIEYIKNIPLSKTSLYIELAEKTNELIDKYKRPVYPPASEILNKPSVTDLEKSMDIFRSWLWASLYYSSQNNSKVALLLAYAPILACQDIEANSADGAAIDTNIIEIQIDACKQLLYLVNFTDIDVEICKKISKNFIEVISAEPSFTRKVDNYIRCYKNIYQFLEKKNNAFAKYVSNSKRFKELNTLLFEGAPTKILAIATTGNFSKFNEWQNDITNELQKIKAYPHESSELFKVQEQIFCQKAFSDSYVNYFYYYCLNLEKLAILRGTAIALGFKAFNSEVNKYRRPVSEYTLNKWLEANIPIDPLSRRHYNFVGYQRYDFVGSPVNIAYYKEQYIKGKYLPLLLKNKNY